MSIRCRPRSLPLRVITWKRTPACPVRRRQAHPPVPVPAVSSRLRVTGLQDRRYARAHAGCLKRNVLLNENNCLGLVYNVPSRHRLATRTAYKTGLLVEPMLGAEGPRGSLSCFRLTPAGRAAPPGQQRLGLNWRQSPWRDRLPQVRAKVVSFVRLSVTPKPRH